MLFRLKRFATDLEALPFLAEKDENNGEVDVKEKSSARNIDLEEGLEDLLKNIASKHK